MYGRMLARRALRSGRRDRHRTLVHMAVICVAAAWRFPATQWPTWRAARSGASRRHLTTSTRPTWICLRCRLKPPFAQAQIRGSSSLLRFGSWYRGLSSQTTTTYDGINLVLFRNASSGNAIATTYWWSSGSRIVDADIVFWDEAFRFFAGSSGCSSGFYIEDIAAHEFGHALGLGHSTSASATMYPSVSSCNAGNRTLDADDIAGARALYPPQSGPAAPTGFRFVS